ncbi:hypothetical protein FOA43_003369 [Brettanomyces nanus]|uniref:Protein BNI4 n=1 Tax=Eeniella nana TaxID=13502 RepID=A0A875S4Y9_EENNA|nr:uncharacterized protein FOA43_003369 [Brettanomyces nanus]QPG75983.1 hypothetical protein FOA43_003369 [Brettanomyces nanus]
MIHLSGVYSETEQKQRFGTSLSATATTSSPQYTQDSASMSSVQDELDFRSVNRSSSFQTSTSSSIEEEAISNGKMNEPPPRTTRTPDISSLAFYSGPSLNSSILSSRKHAQYVRRSIVISPSLNSIHSLKNKDDQALVSEDQRSEIPTAQMNIVNSPSIQALSDILNQKMGNGPINDNQENNVERFEPITEETYEDATSILDSQTQSKQQLIDDEVNSSVATFHTAHSFDTLSASSFQTPVKSTQPASSVAAEQPDLISLNSTVKGTPKIIPDFPATPVRSSTESPLTSREIHLKLSPSHYGDLFEQYVSAPEHVRKSSFSKPAKIAETVKEGDLMTPSLFSPALVFNEPIQSLQILNPDKGKSRNVFSDRKIGSSIYEIGYKDQKDVSFDFEHSTDNEEALKSYEKFYKLHFSAYNGNPLPNKSESMQTTEKEDADESGDTFVEEPSIKFLRKHEKRLSIRLVSDAYDDDNHIDGEGSARQPAIDSPVVADSPVNEDSGITLHDLYYPPSPSLLQATPNMFKSPVFQGSNTVNSEHFNKISHSLGKMFDQSKSLPNTPKEDDVDPLGTGEPEDPDGLEKLVSPLKLMEPPKNPKKLETVRSIQPVENSSKGGFSDTVHTEKKPASRRLRFRGLFKKSGSREPVKVALSPKPVPLSKPTTASTLNRLHAGGRRSEHQAKAKSFAGFVQPEERKPQLEEKKNRRKSLFSGWKRKSFSFTHNTSQKKKNNGKSLSGRRRSEAEGDNKKKDTYRSENESRYRGVVPETSIKEEKFDPFANTSSDFPKGLGITVKSHKGSVPTTPKSLSSEFTTASSKIRAGDVLFPRVLDNAEIESIVSLERSRSLGSTTSGHRTFSFRMSSGEHSFMKTLNEANDQTNFEPSTIDHIIAVKPPNVGNNIGSIGLKVQQRPLEKHIDHFSLNQPEYEPTKQPTVANQADSEDIEQEINEMINIIDFSDGESIDTSFKFGDTDATIDEKSMDILEKKYSNENSPFSAENENENTPESRRIESEDDSRRKAENYRQLLRQQREENIEPEHQNDQILASTPRFHSMYSETEQGRPASMSFKGLNGPAFNSSLKPATRSAIIGSLTSSHISYAMSKRDSTGSSYDSEQYSEPEFDFFADGVQINGKNGSLEDIHPPHRLSVMSKFSLSKSGAENRTQQTSESPVLSIHSFNHHQSLQYDKPKTLVKSRVKRGTSMGNLIGNTSSVKGYNEGRNSKGKSKKKSKKVRHRGVQFSSKILLYTTYAEDEYDRHPEDAACNNLTPELALDIKNELNEFKAQMDVNEDSRCYTHFF